MGTYVFGPETDIAVGLPAARVSDETFLEGFRYCVHPLLLQLRGVECLHASGVVTRLGVVAFCGASGAGKSTIASALNRSGYPQWADDAVYFNVDKSNVPVSVRLPFSRRLDSHAREVIDSLPLIPQGLPNGSGQEPLVGMIILEREEIAKPALEPIPRARAFRETIQHAQCLSLHEVEARHRFTHNYLALAAKAKTARLRFSPNLSRLPELLDIVSAYVESLGRGADSPSNDVDVLP